MNEGLLGGIGNLFDQLIWFVRTNYDPVWDSIDIAIVVVAVYWVCALLRGTRAVQVVGGILALAGLRLLADAVQLTTTLWILDTFLGYGVFIIIVLFAPEIRRALARVGRGVFFGRAGQADFFHLEEIVRAAQQMGERRIGALIVIERENRLEELVEIGVAIDATLSEELLNSIFQPSSPLHDGGVIVHRGRVTYAGCILPLTLRSDLPPELGTRHRAALGLTEETDAVVVVVSEERGSFSLASAGELTMELDPPRLRERLRDVLAREPDLAGIVPDEERTNTGGSSGKLPSRETEIP